jgi:RND family efflux transporter MFP subunit
MLDQQVRLHPIRIEEAHSSVLSAKAQRDRAATSLERCVIRAPFDARIQMVNVEQDQYLQPGAPVLTLADDSLLEIIVPLQSDWIRQWLQFQDAEPGAGQAWFPPVEPVVCRVRWSESPEEHYWTGTLHRIERYERESVTANVAVRVSGAEAAAGKNGLPLVDGMFCTVEIPGKLMQGVFRLPPWAVSYEGEVYVAKDSRLERRKVTVLREQGGEVFVSEGLEPGDKVITTRLVNPLPNTLLEVKTTDGEEAAS